MGQYNSKDDFQIEECTNMKNHNYYFNKQSITKIPLKFYKQEYCWGLYTYPINSYMDKEEIYKTYLFL